MPPDGLLRSRSSSHPRHSSACMADCSASATTSTLDTIRSTPYQKRPLSLWKEVCCGCAEEEEEEMRVRMRQAQRQMKGTKLQYIDQQPILFSDVAGVPGAKVPLITCNRFPRVQELGKTSQSLRVLKPPQSITRGIRSRSPMQALHGARCPDADTAPLPTPAGGAAGGGGLLPEAAALPALRRQDPPRHPSLRAPRCARLPWLLVPL